MSKEEKKEVRLEDLEPPVRFVIFKIKEYLDAEATNNELFSKKYLDPKKSLVKMWIYIGEQAQKCKGKFIGGAVSSDFMFRTAKDYYNYDVNVKTDNIKTGIVMTENKEEDNDFKSNSVYKNMEVDKEYTIEELELDKEWEE